MDLKINRVGKIPVSLMIIIMSFVAFLCVFPYILSIIISLTPTDILQTEGFKIFPSALTLDTYEFVLRGWKDIAHAYLITIIVTILGTLVVLLITLTMGYVLSRDSFKYKKVLTIFIFITMLFNAGLTANYMIMTQFLHLGDTIWALILPLIVNPFWIFIARTFFKTTIPIAIIESAQIDGTSEIGIFLKIILPISKPVIATIGLFSTLTYWNDWFNAKLYITDKSLYTLQYYLVKMQDNIAYLRDNATALGAEYSKLVNNLPDETIVMAVMVIVTIPLAIAYPFFQRYFVSGLTIGSVK